MIGDLYVQSVIDHLPPGHPQAEQIAMELRGHIAERVERSQPLDEIVRQLGDPLTLAESYLSAIPLKSAGIPSRAIAKLIDVVSVLAVVLAFAALTFGVIYWAELPMAAGAFLPVVCVLGFIFGMIGYTAIAEYRRGATIGKRAMGIRVVRESGARISLGQAFVRQLPFLGQFFWIDVLFAFFTDRRQRAFELLTKTRAVAVLLFILLAAPAISQAQPNALDVGAQLLRVLDVERSGQRICHATRSAVAFDAESDVDHRRDVTCERVDVHTRVRVMLVGKLQQIAQGSRYLLVKMTTLFGLGRTLRTTPVDDAAAGVSSDQRTPLRAAAMLA